MEQVPRARARKRGEAGENADLKVKAPLHRIKAAGEPAGVKGGDQAKAPAGVRAKAAVLDKAAAGSVNQLTNQPIN